MKETWPSTRGAPPQDLVQKHSEFVGFPIKLYVEKTQRRRSRMMMTTRRRATRTTTPKVEDVDEAETKKEKKTKKIKEVTLSGTTSTAKPIWMRKPDEVTQEEYAAFYKSLTNDWEDHAAVTLLGRGPARVPVGPLLPRRAPFDMFEGGNKKKFNNIVICAPRLHHGQLRGFHARVPDVCEGHRRFEDLPLNISRARCNAEQDPESDEKNLVKKSIELFNEIAEDEDKKVL